MIFSTITQKGLKTEVDIYDLPTQNSNNFQLKFVKDESYVDYVPTVSLSVVDSAIIQCSNVLEKGGYVKLETDGTFRIKNNIINQDGFLVVSIMMSKRIDDENTENIVLDPVVYKIKANITQVNPLPSDDELWQSVVTAYVQQLFNNDYAPQFNDALNDINEAVNTANTASQNASNALDKSNETNQLINDKIEDGSFIPDISMTAVSGDTTSIERTGTKEAPVFNLTVEKGKDGKGQTTIRKDDVIQQELILSTQRTAKPTYNKVQLKDVEGNVFSIEVSRDDVRLVGKDGREITQKEFNEIINNLFDLVGLWTAPPVTLLNELKNFI